MSDENLYQWKDLSKEKAKQNIAEEVHQAPPLFQEEQAQTGQEQKSGIMGKIEAVMPPKLLSFSNAQEYLRKGFYMFRTKSGKMEKATRIPSKSYMKPVLDGMKKLDDVMQQKIDFNKKEEVQKIFWDVLTSCEKYLEKRKNPRTDEGKARYRMVLTFQKQISYESMRFMDRVEAMEKDPLEIPQDGRWVSVLADVRSHTYENGKDGVKISKGGAGTSDITIVEVNGVKKYFKENEKIPEGNVFINLKAEIERLKEKEDEKSTRRRTLLEDLYRAMHEDFNGSRVKAGDLLNLERTPIGRVQTVIKYLRTDFADPELKQKRSELANRLQQLEVDHDAFAPRAAALQTRLMTLQDQRKDGGEKTAEETEIEEKLRRLEEESEDTDYLYLRKLFTELGKKDLMHDIATGSAKIKEGSEVSKRNVVASRIAKLLQIPNSVAHSEMTEIIVNGKKMRGILMDQAPGKELSTIHMMNMEKKIRYSVNAFKQLMCLQVKDLLTGQVDRNAGNIMFQSSKSEEDPNTIVLDSATGIDNDMCGGELQYQTILKRGEKGWNRIRNIEHKDGLAIPALDPLFVKNILEITPEMLNYQLVDLLTKEERQAMIDRLKGIQKALVKQQRIEAKAKRNHEKFLTKFPTTDQGWKKVIAHYSLIQEDEKAKKDRLIAEMRAKKQNGTLTGKQEAAYNKKIKEKYWIDKFTYIHPGAFGA